MSDFDKQKLDYINKFCSSIAGQNISIDNILTTPEKEFIFNELSRSSEIYSEKPGIRLNWTLDQIPLKKQRLIQKPEIDSLVQTRLRNILRFSPTNTIWPENRSFALCITHDVDNISSFDSRSQWRKTFRYFQSSEKKIRNMLPMIYYSGRKSFSSFVKKDLLKYQDKYSNIYEWMKLEEGFGFTSSFFFFSSSITPWHILDCNYLLTDKVQFNTSRVSVKEVMKELFLSGWDVGLHGSFYSATNKGMLMNQKSEIEKAINFPLYTTRQHTLQYHPRFTPRLQAEAGFLADSTLGFNDTIGFRASTSFPYFSWDLQSNCELPLLEIPLHIQDGPLLRSVKNADDALIPIIHFMDEVQKVSGCLTILFHPHWLATPLGYEVFKATLYEAKKRNAWGCSMKQLANWWNSRLQVIGIN